MKILLVEDNPGDVRLTIEALKEIRSNDLIRVFPNGVEALNYLQSGGDDPGRSLPGLVLLDLNLPRKDGRAVLKEIKEDPELSHIPVVILSSSRSHDDITAAYRLHANCYITKPSNADEFIRVVQSVTSFWLNTASLPENPTIR